MKISEIMNEELKVVSDTGTKLELEDTENPSVKTTIDKNSNKPVSITQNDDGEYEMDLETRHGEVDKKLKPGTVVKPKTKNPNNKPGQHSTHSKPTGSSNTTQGTNKPQGIM